MPSGRFTWNIMDAFGQCVAAGLARSQIDARRKAMDAEARLFKGESAIARSCASQFPNSPAYTFRARKEANL